MPVARLQLCFFSTCILPCAHQSDCFPYPVPIEACLCFPPNCMSVHSLFRLTLRFLPHMASFRPKTLRRRKSTAASSSRDSSTSHSHAHVLSRGSSPRRQSSLARPYTTQDACRAYLARQTPIVAPTGTTFTFRGRQPRDTTTTLSPGSSAPGSSLSSTPIAYSRAASLAPPSTDFPLYMDDPDEDPNEDQVNHVRYTVKHTNQWVTWTTRVIPDLLAPYMTLLHRSLSLCDLDFDQRPNCNCGNSSSKTLHVLCVHFDSELILFHSAFSS